MPKWIQRWVQRVKDKFPSCEVTCEYVPLSLGYEVCIRWEKINEWGVRGIILNPSNSPAVRQNRKAFRGYFDWLVDREMNRRWTKK